MMLTVRLDPALASALDRYSQDRGVTKSLVVQEALAEFLTRTPAAGDGERDHSTGRPVSDNYTAFERAGLIGAGTGDGRPATKDVVRERAMSRLARRSR
jgi:predicted transcriptional regulator